MRAIVNRLFALMLLVAVSLTATSCVHADGTRWQAREYWEWAGTAVRNACAMHAVGAPIERALGADVPAVVAAAAVGDGVCAIVRQVEHARVRVTADGVAAVLAPDGASSGGSQ